jgi:hypothetical protein
MGKKSIYHIIYFTAFFLISEPLLKILALKVHTGLEWGLVWQNLVDNSNNFSRFFCFWVLSPLSGVLLLSLSTLSLSAYFLLSSYRIYAILSYTAYTWPFLSKTPHPSSIFFELINVLLMSYIFYPVIQRFVLSKYLRNYWDARGRLDCNLPASVLLNGYKFPIDANLENISSGGALINLGRLSTYNDLPLKNRDGQISIMDDEGIHHTYKFSIVSYRTLNNHSYAGVEFQDISPRDRILLRTHFLDDLFHANYQNVS